MTASIEPHQQRIVRHARVGYKRGVLIVALGGLAASLVVLWAVLAIAVFVSRPRNGSTAMAAGFVPKIARLVWNLARDRALPKSARWRLYLAFLYNVQPINLIPDFVPVIGFVDNIVVLGWALRSTLNLAGPDVVTRHWPGTSDELDAMYRIMRIKPAPAQHD
jgi:uncharacterized membrane protein YkvA (DUF1232 family)